MELKLSDAQEYLNAVTKEGKVITVNLKIVDSSLAQDLMGTMHNQNIDKFGVCVESWGFWDLKKANELRFDLLKAENERHQQRLADIFHTHDRELLEKYTGEENGP